MLFCSLEENLRVFGESTKTVSSADVESLALSLWISVVTWNITVTIRNLVDLHLSCAVYAIAT